MSVSVSWGSLEAILAPLPELKAEKAAPTAVKEKPAVETNREEIVLAEETLVEEARLDFEPIGKKDLHTEIERSMEDRFRPSGHLSLVNLRDLPDLSAYSQPFNIVLLSVPSRLSDSNIQLRFQVENEKGVIGEWSIPFRPHLFSDVYVVNAHLRRGELPSNDDFITKEIDMLRSPDAVLAYPETLLRHEYSRDLRPGKALQWGDLKERSLVRKGDIVEVVASKGLLAVSMKAISRQDGTEGDIVMLKNLDSHREFAARVVGVNRTEVSF